MGSISDYWENEMLDHVLGTGAYTAETIYVGLSIDDPLDDASGNNEPSTNNYGRVAHASWGTAAARTSDNTGAVTFPQASGAWGLIGFWTLWNASTVGDMLAHGSLAVSKDIVDGNTPSFADGELAVTFSASGSGGGWNDFLVHEMLDHIFNTGSYTPPDLYWALSTSTPTDAGPNVTEPVANNYARKLHAAYDAAVAGASENTGAITFNTPSGSWGDVTHCAAFNALTVGDCLMWGDVEDNTITTDDTVSFADGALDLTLS